jgi:hypothetical protein
VQLGGVKSQAVGVMTGLLKFMITFVNKGLHAYFDQSWRFFIKG